MTRHFVTTANAAYLPRLRVLHASLRRHARPFTLHVLAEGREVHEWCLRRQDVEATGVETLLQLHPDLRPDRLPGPPRTGNELACCWRWTFARDVMLAGGRITPVLCIDADIMLWSSPEPLFEEFETASAAPAAVLPHAFAPASAGLPGVTQESHGRYGQFNGGLVYLADPAAAWDLSQWTRECSHAADHTWPSGRVTWGDQGALTFLVEQHGAHVIQHPGAAPGPWNIHTQPLRVTHDGKVFFGGRPVIAFHYHAFRHRPDGSLERFSYPDYEVTAEQARILGVPYAAALAAAEG